MPPSPLKCLQHKDRSYVPVVVSALIQLDGYKKVPFLVAKNLLLSSDGKVV